MLIKVLKTLDKIQPPKKLDFGYFWEFSMAFQQKLKDIFTDPLFYLICLDYIFTLLIIYYWFWYEINPIINRFWFLFWFSVSLFIYIFYCPKNIDWTVIFNEFNIQFLLYGTRFLYLVYYLLLNIHHIFILLWY